MTTVEQMKVLTSMGTCHVLNPDHGDYTIVLHRHGGHRVSSPRTTYSSPSIAEAVDDLYNYINCRVWMQIEIMDTESALKSSKPTLIIP